MKVTKVTYQKTYNIGPYLTDRVGFEAEPEGIPGDHPEEMLSILSAVADQWHKKEHPYLYESIAKESISSSIGVIQQERTPEDKTIAALIADIYVCQSIEALNEYGKLASRYPLVQSAFDQMTKKLSK